MKDLGITKEDLRRLAQAQGDSYSWSVWEDVWGVLVLLDVEKARHSYSSFSRSISDNSSFSLSLSSCWQRNFFFAAWYKFGACGYLRVKAKSKKKKLLMIFINPLPRCRQCWSSSIIFFYFFCYLWLSFVELFIASHFPCSPLKTFPHVRPIRFWLCEFKQPFSYCLLFTVRVPVPNVALRQHLTIVS